MPYADYTPKEIETRAMEIYADQIKPGLVADDHGRFVVIDVETGAYEVADTDIEATTALMARNPDAVIFGIRIGHKTAYTLRSAGTVTDQ